MRFSELGGGPLGHTLGSHQNFEIFTLKAIIIDKSWQGLSIIKVFGVVEDLFAFLLQIFGLLVLCWLIWARGKR